MEPIKISVLGADGYTCQIPRIKEGIKSLGHTITEDFPDLIYSNDPTGYGKALELKKKFPNTYLIFNFLDIPWHMSNVHEQTRLLIKNYFFKADAVSTISYKVKKDLKNFFDKEIHVIYNPIKDVDYDQNIKKNNLFLFVGRVFDPVKRFNLVRESLIKIKDGINNLTVCGLKDPQIGNYLGVIKDEELNKIYNSSKYVLLPSKAEGLGLPMIEAMVCGAIPITCFDNLTAKEFSPQEFICEPNAESIVKKIEEINKNYETSKSLALKYGKKYKIQFDKKNIAKNIIDIFKSKKL